ncbi:MAG: LLM class flavin-dependent oxidoreductase, partial [Candidatus Binatia bacterium]
MSMRFSIVTLGDNYEHLRSHEQFYHEVLEEAEYAEELGYEGFWVGEHHFQPSQRVFPSPQMMLAAIAQRTKRLRLGTGVSVLPVNDPIRLAEDLAELDLLSHGRVCVGVGRGYQPQEFAGFNIPIESSKERFWECLEIIHGVWTQESFSYDGQFYHYRDIALMPRPLQQPHPPIWVAAASPGSAEEIGRRGYAFSSAPFASSPSPEEIAGQLARYRHAFTAAGHGTPPTDLPHVFWTHVADTTEEAWKTAEAGMKRKLGSSTKVWAKPGTGGYDAFAKVGQFLATATIEQIDVLSIFGDPE